MPSLTALAGRAGNWDRAFMSSAKLRRRTLLGLCTPPPKQVARQGKQALCSCSCNVNAKFTPAREKKSEWCK